MADNTTPLTNSGGNIKKLKEAAAKGISEILDHKAERSAVNAKIAAVRADLEAKGIPKKILAAGLNYLTMTADEREAWDQVFDIVKEVVDDKFQPDMFDND